MMRQEIRSAPPRALVRDELLDLSGSTSVGFAQHGKRNRRAPGRDRGRAILLSVTRSMQGGGRLGGGAGRRGREKEGGREEGRGGGAGRGGSFPASSQTCAGSIGSPPSTARPAMHDRTPALHAPLRGQHPRGASVHSPRASVYRGVWPDRTNAENPRDARKHLAKKSVSLFFRDMTGSRATANERKLPSPVTLETRCYVYMFRKITWATHLWSSAKSGFPMTTRTTCRARGDEDPGIRRAHPIAACPYRRRWFRALGIDAINFYLAKKHKSPLYPTTQTGGACRCSGACGDRTVSTAKSSTT